MLRETVVSAAPANTALTEPENDAPAATSRLALKLISRMLISPLGPKLAMTLAACSPTAKAAFNLHPPKLVQHHQLLLERL